MYDDFTSFDHKANPKIFQKPQQFEKSQTFSKKPQILGQKIWKCMIKEWKRVILEKEANLETENWVGKWIGVKERSLGSWEVKYCREKLKRSE